MFLKFCSQYDSDLAMLCTKFQRDLTEIGVVKEQLLMSWCELKIHEFLGISGIDKAPKTDNLELANLVTNYWYVSPIKD